MTDIRIAAQQVGAGLDADVDRAIKAIRRSDYKPAVIRREVKRLMGSQEDRLRKVLAGQVEQVATMSVAYEEVVEAFIRTGGKGAPPPKVFQDFATTRQLREGQAQARAALSQEVLYRQPEATYATTTRTVGDRILRNGTKPWRDVRLLSRKLHGRMIQEAREVSTQVIAATREAKQLSKATSDLIRLTRKAGVDIGKNQQVSKLADDALRAGRALNSRAGPEALAEWQKVRRRIRATLPRLAEGGRTRTNWIELLQRTRDDSAKGIERAMRHHAADKQRYVAERIIKTNRAVDFKATQILQDQKRKEIIGYIWRLNRVARSGFTKRTKPRGTVTAGRGRRTSGRRRRCICEELNGRQISVEAAKERPVAHPHEPVFDRRALTVAGDEDFD
jgi:hypothetical protein